MKETIDLLKIDRSEKPRKTSASNSKLILLIAFSITIISSITVVTLNLKGYATDRDRSKINTINERNVNISHEQVLTQYSGSTSQISNDRRVLVASGYIVARHKYVVGSKVNGRVASIPCNEGDIVKKGQLLIKLDDQEYQAQFNSAKAELDRLRFDLAYAQKEFKRLDTLLERQLVSQQEVDAAQTRLNMADAMVAQAKAAVSYAQTMLDGTELRAPSDGTVIKKMVNVGEVIAANFNNSNAIVLSDLNDLQVELDISQTDFNRVKNKLECQMNPEAFPDRNYACVIDEISPEANRQKASIQIKVKVLKPDKYLKPEMNATVTFLERNNNGRTPH